ncbi:hypothetical protein [Methanosarcina barkeri]|uniref:hypothetical protein n=1 Tax=Methanosarcina barkeri TaxID=2208 RepID=UPI00003C6836|nr:hypothetical protein [Methanosarcina barkeri]
MSLKQILTSHPTNPYIFPKCGNCKHLSDIYSEHCPNPWKPFVTGPCNRWIPAHPIIYTVLSALDSLEQYLRFKIIYQLDKLDRYCWADLVMWAERYYYFSEVNKIGQCIGLGQEPYCGKCDKFLHNGRRS